MGWLIEQADRFWPDWAIVLWARGAIAMGALFVFVAVMGAVKHCGHGRPTGGGEGKPAFTGAQGLSGSLWFGGGGALFCAVGILVHEWEAG